MHASAFLHRQSLTECFIFILVPLAPMEIMASIMGAPPLCEAPEGSPFVVVSDWWRGWPRIQKLWVG